MKNPFLYILPVLIGLFACQTTLDLPLPPHESRLVLNSFLEPGLPIDLYLTRSYGPLEAVNIQDILIDDADVEVRVDGQDIGALTYRDTLFFPGGTGNDVSGKYTAAFSPVSGQTIEVSVSHPDYPDISATTVVPQPIQIIDASIDQYIVREIFPDGSGRFQSLLNLTIDDPAGIANYYVVDAEIDYEDANFPGQPLRAYAGVQGLARLGENGVYTTDGTLFGDENFDGTQSTVQLLCELPNSYVDPGEVQTLDIKTIYIYAISANEAYAQYQIKLLAQQQSAGGLELLPPEPVVVFSNIENGYGILAASVESLDSIAQ